MAAVSDFSVVAGRTLSVAALGAAGALTATVCALAAGASITRGANGELFLLGVGKVAVTVFGALALAAACCGYSVSTSFPSANGVSS